MQVYSKNSHSILAGPKVFRFRYLLQDVDEISIWLLHHSVVSPGTAFYFVDTFVDSDWISASLLILHGTTNQKGKVNCFYEQNSDWNFSRTPLPSASLTRF